MNLDVKSLILNLTQDIFWNVKVFNYNKLVILLDHVSFLNVIKVIKLYYYFF